MFSDVDQEIELVRGIVAQRFPVYETRVTPQAVQFLVNVDPATMEAQFEDLRVELVPKNYIPTLTKDGGEHVILVQRRAPQRFVGAHVNLVLLILTIATTTWAGAINWAGYADVDWLTAEAFANGSLFFTLPLLAILSIHEMGHYVVAKRYKVHASLPFFIPAPLTFLGTFGAMISMRDPMPNRKALIDIGAAGPILGLITAIPVTLIGLVLMSGDPRPAGPNAGGAIIIELPFLYQILAQFVPIPTNAILHPTAFAGWVGLFVTALNLLPAGQLDGGHVARAVLGENGKYVSWAAIVLMLGLGIFYPGWLIIAVFILLLGARHPPPLNDLTKLDVKRHALAFGALAVLLLSFVAIPVQVIEPEAGVQFEDLGAPGVPVTELNETVIGGGAEPYTFRVVNTGNVETNVTLTLDLLNLPNAGLNASIESVMVGNLTLAVNADNASFVLDSGEWANVTLFLDAGAYSGLPDQDWLFHVKAHVAAQGVEPFDVADPLRFTMHVA